MERLLKWMRALAADAALAGIFRTVSYVSVFLSGYTLLTVFCGLLGTGAYETALELSLALGAAFLLVTAARGFVDAPRPYEIYDFYETKPKNKAGKSFPSRHVFCAFLIGVSALPYATGLALGTLVAGALMAVCRVLLGYHFPRDVIAGAFSGAAAGAVYLLIF